MSVQTATASKTIRESDILHLPEPVQRYARYTGLIGMEPVQTCRLTYTATFRLGEGKPWMPMTATQVYTVNPPTFLWQARFKLFGLPVMFGTDSYKKGQGHMKGTLLKLIPLFDERGDAMNQGSMMRYFNEMMWFPTALFSERVSWQAVDSHQADATFTDHERDLSARFVFDDAGRLLNFIAERYRADSNDTATWSTPIQGYGQRAGLNLPTAGAGVWNLPDDDFDYIRLSIDTVEYNVPVPELTASDAL